MADGYKAVWFNSDEAEMLKKMGISLPFSKFVKAAFYEKLDREDVQKLAIQQVMEQTKRPSHP